MAEHRVNHHDESLDDAIDMMASAGTPDEKVARAPRFPTPLLDAYSVALTSIGDAVRAPDPRVERDLAPVDAIAAASGVMTSPPQKSARWWDSLPGPAVTVQGDSAAAVRTLVLAGSTKRS